MKFFNYSKNIFRVLAIATIITTSVITVSALNPKEYVQTYINDTSEVLGLTTDQKNLPFEVIDLNNNGLIKSNLVNTSKNEYIYSLYLKEGNGIFESNFVTIKNANNSSKKIKIKTNINGEIFNNIKIILFDNLDQITLFKEGDSILREITIPALSERTFSIQYEFTTSINYSFNIEYIFN